MKPSTSHEETLSLETSPDSGGSADKHVVAGHSEYHGIDTRVLSLGADEVYENKVAIMNEALIDIGMGPFQWKVFALTGFGWFVDNVRALLRI